MLTTEDEAMNKSCCRDLNRSCIGRRCMAWRWIGYDNGGARATAHHGIAWRSRAVIFNANGPEDASDRKWYGACGLVQFPLSFEK